MAEEEWQVVEMRDDFYRDSFGKVIFIISSIFIAIALLIAISVYLYMNKPKPIVFSVREEWRIKAAVPLDQSYTSAPDLLQWVSDAIRKSLVYDFYHYNDQLKASSQYFTMDGWKVFLNQLNIYANYNTVLANKMFITAAPASAPYILQQGLLSGRYSWWVQLPVNITYASNDRSSTRNLTLQILVVRVSTLNNLAGVGIDNVIVAKSTGNSPGIG